MRTIVLALLVLHLLHVSAFAQGEFENASLSCEFVFAGDVTKFSHGNYLNTSHQRRSFNGTMRCPHSDVEGFENFEPVEMHINYRWSSRDNELDDRIWETIQSALKYCDGLTALAFSNPAKYILTLKFHNVEGGVSSGPNDTAIGIRASEASSIACGLMPNLTGLGSD